jgi:hypothetical protein
MRLVIRAPRQLDLLAYEPVAPQQLDVSRVRERLPAAWRFGAIGAALEREGVVEYAANPLWSTLLVDLGATGLPERDLRRYAGQLGALPVLVQAPGTVSLPRFPRTAAYGAEGGHANPRFLDPHAFLTDVWTPVHEAFGDQLAALMLSFPPAVLAAGISPHAFAERLERFATALPDAVPLAVEIREPRYLSLDYARTLAHCDVAHVFTSAPGMPTFAEQAAAVPTPAELIVRLDDPVGTQYPSDEQRRSALVELVRASGGDAYLLVGDRAEGAAPKTVARLFDALGYA